MSVLIQMENNSRQDSELAKTYQQPLCNPSLCIRNGVLGTGGDSPGCQSNKQPALTLWFLDSQALEQCPVNLTSTLQSSKRRPP